MVKRRINIRARVAALDLPSCILASIAAGAVKRKKRASGGLPPKPPTVVVSKNHRSTAAADIYVLELEGGKVYVGKSNDVSRRLLQHMKGMGSEFTKKWKPTGKILPRLGDLHGSGDGPERCVWPANPLLLLVFRANLYFAYRDETLRQMSLRGVDNVRGWKYCRKTLSREDRNDIDTNMRELYDLCRICGKAKHFARQCHK